MTTAGQSDSRFINQSHCRLLAHTMKVKSRYYVHDNLGGRQSVASGLTLLDRLSVSAGRYQNCFAYCDTLPTYHDIVTKITNGHLKRKAHTAPKKWKQRVQSNYVNICSGQYLAIQLQQCLQACIPCSIGDSSSASRKMKWKNSLPQALSRYHFQAACIWD